MKESIKNLKNVSPATWARLAVLIAALINNILIVFGRAPAGGGGLPARILSVIITVCAAVVSYWKNNSFTPEAISADEYLSSLREKR